MSRSPYVTKLLYQFGIYPLANTIFIEQTRVYEKLRFDRVRKCQKNGEDVRDRWHSALRILEAGEKLDPDQVKIRVESLSILNE